MKRLEITPEIEARLMNSVGVVPKNIAVFEGIAINGLPVTKRGSIYDKSVVSTLTMQQMAQFSQGAGNFVPFHTLHKQGEELPVGRVFHAATFDGPNGITELRAQYYIDLSDIEGQTLAGKMDNGTIDELSINVLPKHLNCSACGYDYLDPKNMQEHRWAIYDRTCPNDHTVGVDGVHVILNGMARWGELSAVSLGAANGAKIVSKAAAKLSLTDEDRQALAASGLQPEAVLFSASTIQPKEKPAMADENPKTGAGIDPVLFATTLTEKTIAERDLKAAADKITALEAQVASFAGSADKVAKFDTMSADLDAATKVIASQAKFAATALKIDEATIPAKLSDQIKFIEECGVKLHQMFPAGGVADGADKNNSTTGTSNNAASFSTRR